MYLGILSSHPPAAGNQIRKHRLHVHISVGLVRFVKSMFSGREADLVVGTIENGVEAFEEHHSVNEVKSFATVRAELEIQGNC